jgi:competence protein ComEC
MNDPVDPAVFLGAALVAGGLAFVAPGEVAVALAATVGLALAARRIGRGLVVLGIACALLGLLRAAAAVKSHDAARAEADAVLGLPKRCSGHARVISSPVRAREVLRWDAALSGVSCDEQPVAWSGDATLYGGPDDLARGDELEIVATLGEPQRLWNEATGDPRPGEAHRGVQRTGGTLDVRVTRRARGLLPWIDRARAAVRARIDATFPADLAPMARALVLGESDLAPDDDRSFRAAGLSHLLAVSGMHLVLVLALAVKVLEAVLVRAPPLAARMDVGRVAAAVGIPVAWLYAELAGAGGSTVRAAWMATAALGARALGRRTDGPRAFGLSLAAMAVADPLVAFDLSFALSAGATAGLLAFAAPLSARLSSRVPRRLQAITRATGTTLAATIPCTPIIARFAPTVPLGGVVANLLAVPVGEAAALPLCLVHALLFWWPAAERGCAAVASGALVLVRLLARGFAAPALTAQVPQPTSWQLVAIVVALGAIALRVRARAAVLGGCAATMLLLEILARRQGAPHGVLRATFLDVGQGDSAIVDLPDGQAMVIDGGGLVGSPIDVGVRVLAPALRARRRDVLAAVVLSHPHPDHFGGRHGAQRGTLRRALGDRRGRVRGRLRRIRAVARVGPGARRSRAPACGPVRRSRAGRCARGCARALPGLLVRLGTQRQLAGGARQLRRAVHPVRG